MVSGFGVKQKNISNQNKKFWKLFKINSNYRNFTKMYDTTKSIFNSCNDFLNF